MKILFIYSLYEIESCVKPLRSQEQIQLGISYISSLLKNHGHQTKVVVLSRISGVNKNRKILHSYIDDFQPKLLCFTAASSEYKFIAEITHYLKRHYKEIYFLIGGVHVSLNPDGILQDDFDALCVGEGEYPTLELVNSLEKGLNPSGIPNLWIRQKNRIEKNKTRPFIENLDNLPFLDREMWQEWIQEREDSQHSIPLGRGCPFNCTYCSNHALKNIAPGNYIRLRSTDNIIEELMMITKRFPNNPNIYFEIETFYINKIWSIEFCSKLKAFNKSLKKPLRYGVNLRITPSTDYDDLFKACKESNFRFINIGLESGSENIRRNVLKRNYSNFDIIKAVTSARRHDLQVAFYNMIGLPMETYEDFKETLEINRLCLPDWVITSIFFPYPGTELFNLCLQKGYLNGKLDTEMERSRAILKLPNFSKRQVQNAFEWFYYDVYKKEKPIYILLIRVFVNKLRKWPSLFYIYSSFVRWKVYKKIKSFLRKRGTWDDKK